MLFAFWRDLCLVASTAANHSTPANSVLSWYRYQSPAVPNPCRPHFLLQIPFPSVPGSSYSLWPCGVHCSACLPTVSSFLLNVCLSQFYFLHLSCSCTGSSSVFFHSSLLDILSGQCILRSFVDNMQTGNCE